MGRFRNILLKLGIVQRKSGEPYFGPPKSLNEDWMRDIANAQFVVKLSVKCKGGREDQFLTISIPDGSDECDSDEPRFIGDKTRITQQYIDEYVEELVCWKATSDERPNR